MYSINTSTIDGVTQASTAVRDDITDSKYTVADILSSMAKGEPQVDNQRVFGLGLTSTTAPNSTTTITLTPSTLTNIEQTFIELQAASTANATAQDLSRTSGFVPPYVDPVPSGSNAIVLGTASPYETYYDDSLSGDDPDWEPTPAKRQRPSATPSHATSRPAGHRGGGRRREDSSDLTPEERQRRLVRRERNKLAAAKCRQRRVDHTNRLLNETESLEGEKSKLEGEIQSLQHQRDQLEFLLEAHKPMCSKRKTLAADPVVIKIEPEENVVPTSMCAPVADTLGPVTRVLSNPITARARPSTLPLKAENSVTAATGIRISTPSTGVFATLGLDVMMDGHTGLTPLTGVPATIATTPSCASQVQRNSSDSSPSDGLSPTTLIAL